MLNHLDKYKIILGSQSPRRRQLLGEIVNSFEALNIDCEEVYSSELKNEEIALYLADLKSKSYGEIAEGELLITADTIVCVNGETLEKPKDKNESINMLEKLSGKTHQVYTGVCVKDIRRKEMFFDVTHVSFYDLTQEEIEFYIDKCKPFDKAGSYGIQEWMGYAGIKKMEGEFYNVMGLPLHKLYRVLKSWT